MKNIFPCLIICLSAIFVAPTFAQEDEIERPLTEELLPENTVLFLQISNIGEFIERFSETGFGQMLQNEDVAGLVNGVIDEAEGIYEEFKDEVGLELNDFKNLPQGEITFAVIAPNREDMQFALFLEVDEESDAFKNVLARGREVIEAEGSPSEVDDTGEVTFETFTGEDGERFTTFLIDGVFVSCSDIAFAQTLVDRWMERELEESRPLTQNRKFVTVMNRCRGTKDTPPDLRFYFDPIEFARTATRGDAGSQFIINFLPILGLDGLSAIGASAIFDEQGFESVGHAHIMLASPRAGIIKMLALRPGEYKPQSWLPAETSTYVSSSWDLNQFYAELQKIVDTFAGEGRMETEIQENFNDELGIKFKEDLLDQFTGRITFAQWIDFPATVTSQVQVFALELHDPENFDVLQEAIFARMEEEGALEEIEEVDYKGVAYWKANEERRNERMEQTREWRLQRAEERGETLDDQFEPEPPNPCFGIIGNDLIIATNPKFMERAINTERGDVEALVDCEDFAKTTETTIKLLGTDMPAAMFYQQPAAGIEMMFDIASGEDVKKILNSIADGDEEDAQYIGRFKQVIEDNQLPDFDDVRKYFAPGGGFITNDDTGYHMMSFQLKYDDDE